MQHEQSVLDIFDAIATRRHARREFLRVAGGATAAIGGLSLLDACNHDDSTSVTPTPTATATTAAVSDVDILNFALNLEYLEANYYAYAATGAGIAANLMTGTGTQGAVSTSGANPPRAVNFTTEIVIGQYAREIAADEAAHVAFLRTALGSAAVAQPAINISGGLNADGTPGSFTAAARAAGVVGAAGIFDPYSSPTNFLLGAYLFEDVGVTAYKGASPLITSKTYLEAAAGILAVEAYHAALIRTALFVRDTTSPLSPTGPVLPQTAGLIQATTQISAARDSLDGAPADNTTVGIGANGPPAPKPLNEQ